MSIQVPERRSRLATERSEQLSELDQVTERMRRMLDQTFGGFGLQPFWMDAWTPPVDIEETDSEYVIEAELPGVQDKDVSIEHAGNEISVIGEVKERAHKGVLRRQARRTGRFEYRVRLPEQVDPDKIDAKLEGGVLTVRVPKSQRAQRRRIEVKS
jgi:HSP20 family protein